MLDPNPDDWWLDEPDEDASDLLRIVPELRRYSDLFAEDEAGLRSLLALESTPSKRARRERPRARGKARRRTAWRAHP